MKFFIICQMNKLVPHARKRQNMRPNLHHHHHYHYHQQQRNVSHKVAIVLQIVQLTYEFMSINIWQPHCVFYISLACVPQSQCIDYRHRRTTVSLLPLIFARLWIRTYTLCSVTLFSFTFSLSLSIPQTIAAHSRQLTNTENLLAQTRHPLFIKYY